MASTVTIKIVNDDGSSTSITASGATVVNTPAPAPTPIPDPVPPPPTFARFPGDIAAGKVRWGAAVGGNGDPTVRHEQPAGKSMGLRRTFWRLNQADSLVNTATADLAKKRLPWVSIKPDPYTWAQLGGMNSSANAALDALLKRLGALQGPVWFTVHHEPENDDFTTGPAAGGAPAWRQMQINVRNRINALGIKNVAFAPILMAWTFDAASKRNPADWWVDGIWDFAGIDHYQETEADTVVGDGMWQKARAWYTARNKLPIAVGEWGNRGTNLAAANEMTAWYEQAIASGTSAQSQIVGLAAFDSGLNSPSGSWELVGEPLTRFHALMKDPRSLLSHQTT